MKKTGEFFMSDSNIIVISGVTASGKTTLTKALLQNVENAYALFFDDYSIDALPNAPTFNFFLKSPKVAINQYDISALITDLKHVKNQYDHIFIDFPFGYEHDVLAPFIDTVLYMKTPLDVTLARQVLRDYTNKSKEDIIEWLDIYLNYARRLFVMHETMIAPSADYLLDGTKDIKSQIDQLSLWQVI